MQVEGNEEHGHCAPVDSECMKQGLNQAGRAAENQKGRKGDRGVRAKGHQIRLRWKDGDKFLKASMIK